MGLAETTLTQHTALPHWRTPAMAWRSGSAPTAPETTVSPTTKAGVCQRTADLGNVGLPSKGVASAMCIQKRGYDHAFRKCSEPDRTGAQATLS